MSEREKIEAPDRRSVTDEGEVVKEIWEEMEPAELLAEFQESVGGWEFSEAVMTCRVQGKSIEEWVEVVRAQIAAARGNAMVHPFKQTQFNGYPGVSVSEWRQPYRDLLLRTVKLIVTEAGFVEKTVVFAMLVTGRAWSWKTLTNYVLRRAGDHAVDLMESVCALTSGGQGLKGEPVRRPASSEEEVEEKGTEGKVLAAVSVVGGKRRELVDTSRSDPGEGQPDPVRVVAPGDAIAALDDPEGDDEALAEIEGLALLQQVEQNEGVESGLERESAGDEPSVSDDGEGAGPGA